MMPASSPKTAARVCVSACGKSPRRPGWATKSRAKRYSIATSGSAARCFSRSPIGRRSKSAVMAFADASGAASGPEVSAGANCGGTVDVATAAGTEDSAWSRFRALATRCSLAATSSTYHRFRTRCDEKREHGRGENGEARLIYDVAVTESRYLRYPNLHGDLLTFVADDDVWLAPSGGGRAWRISADRAPAAGPKFSGDGSLVAWTSLRDGPPEVYLTSTGGGDSIRVSYWSNQYTRLRGWSPDGDILATTAADQPFQHYTWAYTIPVSDGTSRFAEQRRLPYGPVADVAMDGRAIALLTASYQDPAYWKRYRGGTSGRLWVAAEPDGGGDQPSFRRLLADLAGQFHSPMLVGGRLAFISDFEGTANIYSCALDGTDLRRHTDHDGMYARNASTDGTKIVYQNAGDIWVVADLGAASEPVRLDLSLGAPAAGRATKLFTADEHLDGLSCDTTARASAVQVRGTVHWLTHREGPARALSLVGGPVARLPRVLGDTGDVVWVAEMDEADALEIAPADGTAPGEAPRRLATGQIGWVADLAASPDGAVVATAARDGRLLLVDAASGEVTELARSDNGPITDLAFSPDSGWLAWAHPGTGDLRRLTLARLADRQGTHITA